MGDPIDCIHDSKNYIIHDSSQEIGSVIQTDGDLILNAGNNVSARAASMTNEQGNLTVNAGNDVSIEAGTASSNIAAARHVEEDGFLSSSESTTRYTANDSNVSNSTFSGNSVDVNAGHDLTVSGSNIVATNDVNLNAGNNVTLTTAQTTHDETFYGEESSTGFTVSSSRNNRGRTTNTNKK